MYAWNGACELPTCDSGTGMPCACNPHAHRPPKVKTPAFKEIEGRRLKHLREEA
jgi:hypothetical protein